MLIIPAINCPDLECVKEKLGKAAEFADWVQLDIADGKFTPHKTWNKPTELAELGIKNNELGKLNIETHLMVENPELVIDNWIKAGAKRIIIHLEALQNFGLINKTKVLEDIGARCKKGNIELGLAINPETPVEKLESFINIRSSQDHRPCDDHAIKFVQVLAVSPGKSGQKFDKRVLEKIRFLKKNYPDVIIEVDGGINLETAKLCKEAGAGILVAGNYIWGSKNPQGAYEELQIATDKGRMATDRGAGSKAGLLYKELTYRLRGIFYSVRNKYGKHHKEKIYQNALKEELDNASINYLTEPRLDIVSVSSGRKIGTYVPDFLIDDKIIIELKASPFTTKDMEMQLIEYLKTSRYELAFLVNFGEFSFKPRRYIHTSDRKFIANQ